MGPIPYDSETERALFEQTGVVSATDCTGLEPIPPETLEETEGFAELYDIPLAEQDVMPN